MRKSHLRQAMLLAGVLAAASFDKAILAADGVVTAEAEAPVVAIKPVSNSNAVLLKYRFEPNQSVHYTVTQKMAIFSQKGRAQQTALSEWTTAKHIQVVSTDAAATTLHTTIDRIQATVQIDDGKAEKYDSISDAEPPAPLKRIIPTIGRPLAEMQFNPAGKLLRSEMLRSKNPDDKGQQSDDNSDPSSKNFLITLSETPVKVGDTWKDSFTVNVSIPPKLETPVTLIRTYKLISLENGIATIGLETSVITPVNSPAVMAQLIMKTPSGTILFDSNRGLIISKTLKSSETVHEFAGGGSQMRAESTLTETITEPKEIAAKPKSTSDSASKQ